MKFKTIRGQIFFKSAAGAALTILLGLVLWKTDLGEPWVNTSYDYLFRFGARIDTNKVILILMDNEAYDYYRQNRDMPPWNRALHTRLLNRLADDGCSLVVMDCFIHELHDPETDEQLARAMRRQRNIVPMADQAELTDPKLSGAHPIEPHEFFLNAVHTNWGVAWFDPDLDKIVRRHWPFPEKEIYPSLPGVAAQLAGARSDEEPQWLRYYGRYGSWTNLS